MIHETPSTEIFQELIEAAAKVWNTKDNTHGYVTEKIDRINLISNYQDNVMMSYRMFDGGNQSLMRAELSDKALNYIDANI
jgi:hypothetical protein